MIIANIGHAKLILPDLDAATQLLGILERSKPVDTVWLSNRGEHVLAEDPGTTTCEIKVCPEQKILTTAEAEALRKADSEQLTESN